MSLKEICDNFIKMLRDECPYIVKEWAAEFRERDCMKDYEQSGHPKKATTNENVEFVHSLIMCEGEEA